jgi:general secretion pathway protein N
MSMKKRGIGYIVFGLAAYCLFLVAAIPADRAFQVLQRHSDFLAKRVWVSGLTGTLWSGLAPEAMIDGVAYQNLAWDFKPAGLLLGRLNVMVRFHVQEGTGRGLVSIGRNVVVIREVAADLPVAYLAEQLGTMGVGVAGTLSAHLERLALRQGRITEAVGTVLWSGAQVTMEQPIVLGDLKVDLTTQDGGVRGVFVDGGGPFAAQGMLTLAADGAYTLKGTLRARDSAQPALRENLQLLGRPDKEGSVQVALSGLMPVISF